MSKLFNEIYFEAIQHATKLIKTGHSETYVINYLSNQLHLSDKEIKQMYDDIAEGVYYE